MGFSNFFLHILCGPGMYVISSPWPSAHQQVAWFEPLSSLMVMLTINHQHVPLPRDLPYFGAFRALAYRSTSQILVLSGRAIHLNKFRFHRASTIQQAGHIEANVLARGGRIGTYNPMIPFGPNSARPGTLILTLKRILTHDTPRLSFFYPAFSIFISQCNTAPCIA